jgi:tetratricopeptide (TPR) repeat protein
MMSDGNPVSAAPTPPTNPLDKSLDRYAEELRKLESTTPEPSCQQIIEVLVARDEVEKQKDAESHPTGASIFRLIELDGRLKALANAIATNQQLCQWKEHVNALPTSWWWQIATGTPYFTQCLESYEEALTKLEDAENPSVEQALKVLKARDAVEITLKNQPSVPETIAKTIIELDQRLKQQRTILTKDKQLLEWKKSLSPPESHWWWNFHPPSIFAAEDDSMSFIDRLWIVAAIALLGVAAAFVVDTAQKFQTFGKTDKGVGSDAFQNLVVILQGGGLLTLTASALTKKGQKLLEDTLTSIPFISPKGQAPTTFGLSCLALGAAIGINRSLPFFGDVYYKQGQEFAEEGQLFKAQEKYLQADKFLTDNDGKAKLSLALGKVYEQQGNMLKAIETYNNALATDDPNVINNLSRAMLLDGLEQVGWTGKIKDDKILSKVEIYIQLVRNKLKSVSDPQKQAVAPNKNLDDLEKKLDKEVNINDGILQWARVDLNKPNWNEYDNKLLKKAKDFFQKAQELDEHLPTTPEGRNTRCYKELAWASLNLQYTKKWNTEETYTICEEILDASPKDINEARLMKATFDLFVDKALNPRSPNVPFEKVTRQEESPKKALPQQSSSAATQNR